MSLDCFRLPLNFFPLPLQTFYVDMTNEVKEFSLLVNLTGGVGLSVVNSTEKLAEELIYMTIVNLDFDYLFNR